MATSERATACERTEGVGTTDGEFGVASRNTGCSPAPIAGGNPLLDGEFVGQGLGSTPTGEP